MHQLKLNQCHREGVTLIFIMPRKNESKAIKQRRAICIYLKQHAINLSHLKFKTCLLKFR